MKNQTRLNDKLVLTSSCVIWPRVRVHWNHSHNIFSVWMFGHSRQNRFPSEFACTVTADLLPEKQSYQELGAYPKYGDLTLLLLSCLF
jgi:hypothetical protein